MRHVQTLLLTVAILAAASFSILAVQKPPAASSAAKSDRISACSLLTRDEVKKLVPWAPMLDQFPSREEPIGATGSACSHPSVHIQVMSFSRQTIDAAKKRGKLEPAAGVGDEAYLYENPSGYLELYAKVGTHLVTVQKSVRAGEKVESVRPGVIALARALAAKLR